jgi:LuxR family maltose regulon positive regulatory protein
LVERLDRGIERKLTVVSAPAGFGKSTLLAEWLATTSADGRPAAWVSLDQSDNDPALFWSYFITALQKVHSGVGESALSLSYSPQAPPIEVLLGTLLNEITTYSHNGSTSPATDFAVVLDDYHFIDSQPIHDAVTFLVDHLPPPMHMVIAGRADPPLSLSRLRGRGELTELRASDLSFTPDEASAFLSQSMGLDLAAGDMEALETRTEGWVAGLQLAALSMQGRKDVSGFIEAFAGDDRYIVDYLIEEVLLRQPEDVRSFLLQTAILDRLSGPLCDAVTGLEQSTARLETLERGNLFVVPLDDKRHWYRYHHLFAEVLQARAVEEQSGQVAILHRRASEWYECSGLPADAVRHALAAEDYEHAAGLIEVAWPTMQRNLRSKTILGWVKKLPDDMVRVRPVLSVAYTWMLFDAGDLEAAESRLRDAERWLDAAADTAERQEPPPTEMVVVDEEQFRLLPGAIAAARAYYAGALGDVPGTMEYARQALDLIPENDHFMRTIPTALLGLAYLTVGDLDEAHRSMGAGMASLQSADDITSSIGIAPILANIRIAQGRLSEAIGTYERALQLATNQGELAREGVADLYLGLSELHHERGNPETATAYLLKTEELSEGVASPEWPYCWTLAQARMKEGQGDLDAAIALLDEAEGLHFRSPMPEVRPIAAVKTRLRIAQGNLAEAMSWAREQGLSVDDDLSYLREFEHITLARLLIARYRNDRAEHSINEAIGPLERLLKAADEGERTGSIIEVLVQQALAHEAQGDIPAGLASLERALTLAEPEGYLRIFIDGGEPMRKLLRHAAAEGVASSYTRRLLAAFGAPAQPASNDAPAAVAELAEPLSEREIEILRLIAAGMKNQEIADQLVVSMSTIKTHINRTYRKLDVSSRTQAIVKIRELGIA